MAGVFNYEEEVEQEYIAEERQQRAEQAKTWQKVIKSVSLDVGHFRLNRNQRKRRLLPLILSRNFQKLNQP